MNNNWVPAFKTTDFHQANILLGMLHENEIECVLLNGQDSMHIHLNQNAPIQLMVPKEKLLLAIHYIKSALEE